MRTNISEGFKLLSQTSNEMGYTYFHIECIKQIGGPRSFNISSQSILYLVEPMSIVNNTLNLIHSTDVPLAPSKHKFGPGIQTLKFTLVFPYVPSHWEMFSLILHPPSDSFINRVVILDIHRKENGIYRIKFNCAKRVKE
jgi:hypothetical protein